MNFRFISQELRIYIVYIVLTWYIFSYWGCGNFFIVLQNDIDRVVNLLANSLLVVQMMKFLACSAVAGDNLLLLPSLYRNFHSTL